LVFSELASIEIGGQIVVLPEIVGMCKPFKGIVEGKEVWAVQIVTKSKDVFFALAFDSEEAMYKGTSQLMGALNKWHAGLVNADIQKSAEGS
jgi:hypothetical protein